MAAKQTKTPVDAGRPTLSPEELFAEVLAPKPATPKASVEHIIGESFYVMVNGRPAARNDGRADAEHSARNW